MEDVKLLTCNEKIRAIHDTMDVLSGKWKVSIIACLCYKGMRYSELMRQVPGISGKMLSRELKDLEMNKLIERTVAHTKPVCVHYKITPYGASLKELTEVIATWGLKHRELITH
ncbi:HxlR family transcriptional regulator [Leeuwenhoekiella aestuarii]|uniref:HxlR family transcriptional regulator n=1 Tax=Leeuwenhoekiella aestuarii TaxID=2249426 RepID=A0A4V1KPM7_9FLAO|nr:helix-turn-helix domain-containing protein [Leeuwenhoekiella aestuarii]RXG15941.1 HxlR family transcriptional regulator [Leeuwenhoekiella aestuarii]RXG16635.1 HxlR family transcriptional regulator [Leeuwenhoekiella aestuarii]